MSIEDVQRKQAETAKNAAAMAKETDADKIIEMSKQVIAQTQQLEKMAMALAAQFPDPGAGGDEVRVVLTPAQKARLTEATGVGLEVLVVQDRDLGARMKKVDPREIEARAAKEAAISVIRSATRTQVEAMIKQMEALEVPELAETIAKLKADPTLEKLRSKNK